jgi:hypothetical protein
MAEDEARTKYNEAQRLVEELKERIELERVNRAVLFLLETYVATEAWAIQRIVDRNLDSAKENGYFNPGEQLDGATAEEIAADMLAYASDVEGFDTALLIPFVQNWIDRQRR